MSRLHSAYRAVDALLAQARRTTHDRRNRRSEGSRTPSARSPRSSGCRQARRRRRRLRSHSSTPRSSSSAITAPAQRSSRTSTGHPDVVALPGESRHFTALRRQLEALAEGERFAALHDAWIRRIASPDGLPPSGASAGRGKMSTRIGTSSSRATYLRTTAAAARIKIFSASSRPRCERRTAAIRGSGRRRRHGTRPSSMTFSPCIRTLDSSTSCATRAPRSRRCWDTTGSSASSRFRVRRPSFRALFSPRGRTARTSATTATSSFDTKTSSAMRVIRCVASHRSSSCLGLMRSSRRQAQRTPRGRIAACGCRPLHVHECRRCARVRSRRDRARPRRRRRE